MKKILLAACICIVLAGCSKQESKQSYVALLMADGKDYHAEGLSEEYSLGKELGTISNKVDANVKPSQNFWSNYLDKGTVLYRAKEEESVILVKKGEKIEVFRAAE
ncbi:membrane lipoprotein lipid attachment site-containing protein [Metabacillus indicus]|uniref:membrane lipoprotein lipid attachment site-containing protein n=1 Tax=Metabacillus indicus TaxID=246786 RepID=UPI0005544807|nr:membrane lipoprotein lipid attachment site-containing protein [Metabacillus indicus]